MPVVDLPDEAATAGFAAQISALAAIGDIIALKGDLGAGSHQSKVMMPLSIGPSDVLSEVLCGPVMVPQHILVLSPISCIARIKPTLSGG